MKFKTEKDIAKHYWIPYRTYLSRVSVWTLPKAKLILWRKENIERLEKELKEAKGSAKYIITK